MIVHFFVGRSSNPTSEYNFNENICLYFLFLTNLFNVFAGTTPSQHEKDFLAVDKPMIRVTDCTSCTII